MVFVFLAADGLELSPELRYFALLMNERLTYIHHHQGLRTDQPPTKSRYSGRGEGKLTLAKSLASCPELIVAFGIGKGEFNRSQS
jgi:hypothetical protein